MHNFSWKPEDTAITPAGTLAVLSIETDALTPHQVLSLISMARLAAEGTDFEHSDKITLRQLTSVVVVSCSIMSCSFVTLGITAHQVPLSREFPRQEYWSGLPVPSPGDLSNPGTEPESEIWLSPQM